MTGMMITKRRSRLTATALATVLLLAACDENGEFAFPGAGTQDDTSRSQSLSTQPEAGERDVARPDIFEVTDRGLWDGRPSLGGIWVAHPDVTDPERVIIRNQENGREVVGALFRRERENPGPLLQVSSDAAEALGALAGAPTELNVIVLRREQIEVEEPAEPDVNPVIASLEAPVSVEAAPLDPIAGAAAAIEAADSAVDATDDVAGVAGEAAASTAAVVLPPSIISGGAEEETPTEDAPSAVDVAALPVLEVAGEADLSGPQFQIGIFSIEANANAAAQRLRDVGAPATVVVQQAGGRNAWRSMASPTAPDADPAETLTRIKAQGFADAFLVEVESDE